MAYYNVWDSLFILFFGFAVLCLGALILNRQTALSRAQSEHATGGRDITGLLLNALSVITGLLVFALVIVEMLL